MVLMMFNNSFIDVSSQWDFDWYSFKGASEQSGKEVNPFLQVVTCSNEYLIYDVSLDSVMERSYALPR